jgi:hypothetical protein
LKLTRSTGSRFILAGVGLCTLGVVYFFLLDRLLFSGIRFSPIFRFLLTTYDFETAWLALAVCIFAAFWNHSAPILRLVDFLGNHPLLLASASIFMLSLGALLVYHDYPLSMDEYAGVFQSKIFARGNIFTQLPAGLQDWLIVRGFNGSFLTASSQNGRAIEQYWPGFALLLAPFQFFSVPWLCNASISGLAIYLIYWITKEITSDLRAAGWAMLFALASGAFVANGLSYYSMQAHLAANLLFVALLIKHSRYAALGAGLVGSLALILHNPVPHALFALPWIAATALQRDRRQYLLPLIVGYLPGLAVGLEWLTFRSDIGSGNHELVTLSAASEGVFSWPDAAIMNMRVAALVKMWIWAAPCLFLFALRGFARYRADLRVRLLASSATLTFVGYLFVKFDQGHGWGYRYFHSAWGVVPILAACAMTERSASNTKLVTFAGATATLGLLIIVPFQLNQIERVISAHLAQLGPPLRPGNNIYFVHPLNGFYVSDMVQFDPFLRDRDLLLVSHGAELDNQLILQNWPNAVIISSTRAADQWYLGPEDRRITIPGGAGQRQFVIAHIPR